MTIGIRARVTPDSLEGLRNDFRALKTELRQSLAEAMMGAGILAVQRIRAEFFIPMPLEDAVGKKLDLMHGRDLGGYKSPSLVQSLLSGVRPTRSGASMFYGSVSRSEATVGKARLFEGYGQDGTWEPFSVKTLRAAPGKAFIVPVDPVVVKGRKVRTVTEMREAGWFVRRVGRAYVGISPETGERHLLFIGPLESIKMPSRPFLTMQLLTVVNEVLEEVSSRLRRFGLVGLEAHGWSLRDLIEEAKHTPANDGA